MSLEWEVVDRLARGGETDALARLLHQTTEADRLAFATEFETRVKAVSAQEWWGSPHDPALGYALVAIGCLPSAARTATLLCRAPMRNGWSRIRVDRFLEIARSRSLPWLGDLGVRLAARLSPRAERSHEWLFAAALLRAGEAEPPVTEGVVRGWLSEMHGVRVDGKLVPLAESLRASPYLDLLLPSVFTVDGVGQALNVGHYSPDGTGWQTTPRFPSAVAQLVTEGRLDRRRIYTATVERLVRGDRPAFLRPFAMLLEALAPTPDELADHVGDYARLLPDSPSPIAALAQRALRTVDDHGRLELETALEASRSVLVRKEKSLVKSQLTWLEKIARRDPDRIADVLATVATAFGQPALDLQERALSLIGRHLRTLDPRAVSELADAAAGLAGDLPARAAELFGTALPETAPLPVLSPPMPAAPAALPPPIRSAAELAEEVIGLIREESGAGWERVLAGIVTLRAAGETAALTEVLGPVLERHADDFDERYHQPRIAYLGEALRSVVDPTQHGRAWQSMIAAVRAAREEGPTVGNPMISNPNGVLSLRIAELSVEVTRAPVPELMATPTSVTGSLDAETLLDRLLRAESDGRRPWPVDFEQALLRVPRQVDVAVLARAGTLTSAAGRHFAASLAGGGVPDPASTRFEQRATGGFLDGGSTSRRVLVNLTPARTGGLLENHLMSLERRPRPNYSAGDFTGESALLVTVLPHHREVAAAWALPAMARLADQDDRGGATLLPLLAEASGPIGPAMCLALTYVFCARHETDRIAGVDAFLALAATDVSFAPAMGAHLGDLCADGTVKLSRALAALSDAHRAGASAAVWEVLAAALPPLLPPAPRGLPDLLELAVQVASVVGAKGEIAHLADAAAKSGSRLAREARRLRTVLAS